MANLHHDAVVVDCHNDFILLVAHKQAVGETRYFAERVIPQLRTGGIDVQVVPIFIEGEHAAEGALRRALLLIEMLCSEAEANADEVALCHSGADIDMAVRNGKIALVLEGSEPIGRSVELLRTFYRLGVRIVSFTHFGRTLLADGSGEDGTGSRLTQAGVLAVWEMEHLGILIDVSHLSRAGTEHVLELASRPIIASHSSARALRNHHRNLTDEQLRAIAATGGVIGVNCFPAFVAERHPTVEQVVDHIEHVATVAGVNHVGLGPDFIKELMDERYPQYPAMKIEGLDAKATIPGLAGPQDLPTLTEAMLRRGLSDADVRKILGENFLRVFRAVVGIPRMPP